MSPEMRAAPLEARELLSHPTGATRPGVATRCRIGYFLLVPSRNSTARRSCSSVRKALRRSRLKNLTHRTVKTLSRNSRQNETLSSHLIKIALPYLFGNPIPFMHIHCSLSKKKEKTNPDPPLKLRHGNEGEVWQPPCGASGNLTQKQRSNELDGEDDLRRIQVHFEVSQSKLNTKGK
ncbi:hypothetical protein CDAR_390191 [Caerostris darwini]|uniref:Uncharacterized protein n=1 Tax=Caerostris darwini TaxID=1538125 RepID=A0AAV4P0Z9_9ARAC|nr:hypothetical protein CDAR_390191 [Caerostris darwini]